MVIKSTGEDNKRADFEQHTSGTLKLSGAGMGESVGGTDNKRAKFQVKSGKAKITTPAGTDRHPEGRQSYNGMARD